MESSSEHVDKYSQLAIRDRGEENADSSDLGMDFDEDVKTGAVSNGVFDNDCCAVVGPCTCVSSIAK